jgi:hypothetical protein
MRFNGDLFKILMSFSLVLWLGHGAFAQIKGTITDQTTHQPVIGASIYVNNTTYGCQSNIDGQFDLQTFPEPPFQIIVSSVGYQSASFDVRDKQMSGVQINLKPKANDLNEVVIIAPEKNGWELYGKEFIRDFIGYSAFADECEILNKKDIEFRDDRKNNRLLVSVQKPIKIRNNATGYLITYWLDNYELDYLSKRLFYKGNVQFEVLQSKKEKTINRWKANRESAYNGSLNHFMRSVYNNTVYEDSFELRVYKRIKTEEYGKTVPFKTIHLNGKNDSAISKAVVSYLYYSDNDLVQLQPSIEKWLHAKTPYRFTLEEKQLDSSTEIKHKVTFDYDTENPKEKSIQYFDYDFIPEDTAYEAMKATFHIKDANGNAMPPPKRKQPETFAYLWKQKMPLDSFVTRMPDHDVILKFKNHIHVTYLKEKEESAYLNGQHPPTHFIPEQQQSLITLENPDGVHVLADGNFYDAYDLITEEYWSYEKLDKLMPLDYDPSK